MKVALVFNVREAGESDSADTDDFDDTYAEWDAWTTIHAMRDAIATKHEVVLVEHDGKAGERLRGERPDLVFNFAEGIGDARRESVIPMICEELGLAYTGSGPLALERCLDKNLSKQALQAAGIATPSHTLVAPGEPVIVPARFPVIVKPVHEGSSKGIFDASFVHDEAGLVAGVEQIHRRYDQAALIETYLPGREFTVAVLGNGAERRCLPIVEIDFSRLPAGTSPIYSYEAKWIWDTVEEPLDIHLCPAPISPELEARLQATTLAAIEALDVHDWCRADLRLDAEGTPHIIELNPLPGLHPDPRAHSLFTNAARTAGMSYEEIVLEVVRIATARSKGSRAGDFAEAHCA